MIFFIKPLEVVLNNTPPKKRKEAAEDYYLDMTILSETLEWLSMLEAQEQINSAEISRAKNMLHAVQLQLLKNGTAIQQLQTQLFLT